MPTVWYTVRAGRNPHRHHGMTAPRKFKQRVVVPNWLELL